MPPLPISYELIVVPEDGKINIYDNLNNWNQAFGNSQKYEVTHLTRQIRSPRLQASPFP